MRVVVELVCQCIFFSERRVFLWAAAAAAVELYRNHYNKFLCCTLAHGSIESDIRKLCRCVVVGDL